MGAPFVNTCEDGGWTLLDAIRSSDKAAIIGCSHDGSVESALTHNEVRELIGRFDVRELGIGKGSRVALIMPNGPNLGAAVILLMAQCTVVPIDITRAGSEITSTLGQLKATFAVFPYAWRGSKLVAQVKNEAKVAIRYLTGDCPKDMYMLAERDEPVEVVTGDRYCRANDKVLVLNTSGTSGKKKVIVYTLKKLVWGAQSVAKSWALTENDVNLNMMPLCHIGGIIRNLLAPVVIGGSTILAPGFDQVSFWNIYMMQRPTWYYAVPSMHMAILDEGRRRAVELVDQPIRMICNAGGGMQHSLAVELRMFFKNSIVLPSYGMSECMPISTPPVDYALERPGTSGRSVGPEIEIAIFSPDSGARLAPRKVGAICVRGKYVFDGYEGDTDETEKVFNSEGFFNTGDVGYLDEDSYLFIIGRSKEIINRGGEVISPVDVEDALRKHPDIADSLAFSVPHASLQEVVGVVLVMRLGRPRPTVATLDQFLAGLLHPSHWPRLIVFMDVIPRNSNNKLMRIKLSTRLGLKELQGNESPQSVSLLYEARCPPTNSSISESIMCWGVTRDLERVREQAMLYAGVEDAFVVPDGDTFVLFVMSKEQNVEDGVRAFLEDRLNAYELPARVVQRTEAFPIDGNGTIQANLLMKFVNSNETFMTSAQILMAECFSAALGIDVSKIAAESDFFELGGDSLKVGRLLYYIRGAFNFNITAIAIYTHRTLSKLTDLISRPNDVRSGSIDSELTMTKENVRDMNASPEQEDTIFAGRNGPYSSHDVCIQTPPQGYDLSKSEKLFRKPKGRGARSDSLLWLALTLSPLLVVKSARITVIWTIFAYFLVSMRPIAGSVESGHMLVASAGRLLTALALGFGIGAILMPIISIIGKWLIIGQYREGDYPLFGGYYKRWWFVEQLLTVNGRGVFGLLNITRVIYYRALGAKIGKNVKIDRSVRLGECDLISIGDNTEINSEAWIRPYTMCTGRMMLRRIVIGNNCVMNAKSTLAPGCSIAPFTVLPHMASSHEVSSPALEMEKFRKCSAHARCSPNFMCKVLIGYPIIAAVNLIAYLPWISIVVIISTQAINGIEYSTLGIIEAVYYFSNYRRLILHLAALAAKRVIHPLIYGFLGIAVKRTIIGKFKEGPAKNTQWERMQYWLARTLFTGNVFQEFYAMLGSHYGATSLVYRMLGAKVGSGIFWPGKHLMFFEFDLVEFGNNLIFGSRSHIYCSDALESKRIRLADGSMVADRCVVLPGVQLGKNCVLGSGTLATGDKKYPPGSTWAGSYAGEPLLWDLGDSSKSKIVETGTPFSRAYYERRTPYFILPYVMWLSISLLCRLASVLLWNFPITASLLAARSYLDTLHLVVSNEKFAMVATFEAIIIIWATIGLGSVFVLVFTLLMDITAKYILLGTRNVGTFDWDTSSYCQRWKVYLMISRIRSECLDYIRGTHLIVLFFRMLGAKIGKNVCLYPLGAEPMMTEPDLVEIGDNVAIDRASLVAHINSRGHFSLNRLKIGSNAVLRSNSRVLSGSEVQNDATLLEHTLLLSGDVADRGGVFQGWPSKKVGPRD